MPKEIGGILPAETERRTFQLFKVGLRDGSTLRYTDADLDLAVDVADGAGRVTWAAAPGISRTEVRASIDLQIDDTKVSVPNVDLTIGAVTRSIAHWAKVRYFHGARVDLYLFDHKHAAAAAHSTWTIQSVERASIDEVIFTLESFVAKLDVQIPRTIYQQECNNALFDEICGVVRSVFRVASTVASATIDTVTYGALSPSTPVVAPSYADGYFDLGVIEFMSGNLVGLRQTIGGHAGGAVTGFAPFPEVPDAGSAIDLYPGCHKDVPDCRDKFGSAHRAARPDWRRHFRGFPYMPPFEETVG